MPPTPTGIDASLSPLARALGASILRHQTIQTNLANANTPGFKRSDVQFESLLNDNNLSRGLMSTEPRIVRDMSPGRGDGNNVEFDHEYAALEKNRLQFEALAEIASLRIQGIKSAISSK